MSKRIVISPGTRFGKLVVVKQDGCLQGIRTAFLCKCDCGKEIRVAGTDIKKGHTKSCGCSRCYSGSEKIMAGQRFGKLVVIGRARCPKENKLAFLCLCDCGQQKVVTSSKLRSGHTRSCGCLSTKATETKRNGRSHIYNETFAAYVKSAQIRRLPFTIPPDDFDRLIFGNCHYCGREPVHNAKGYRVNGIDRIDSSLGYTPENSVSCCSKCNYMKNKMGIAEFTKQVFKIADYMRGI